MALVYRLLSSYTSLLIQKHNQIVIILILSSLIVSLVIMLNVKLLIIILLILNVITYQYDIYNKDGIKKIDAVILTTGKDLRTFEIGIESALNHLVDVYRYWIITTHKEQLEKVSLSL